MKYFAAAFALIVIPALPADTRKLEAEDRIEIMRGLTAEYATAKVAIPRSKKILGFNTKTGKYDRDAWAEASKEYGPAARVGDLVQITKIEIHKDAIELQINGGFRNGPKWHERIQVGMGSSTAPIGHGKVTNGTSIRAEFEDGLPPLEAKEIKKLLAPILDFEKRSATENYLENLPEPVKAAIKDKRVIEGMDKEQVLIAVGKPRHKQRETKDGVELEDWIYGEPPGKITFVTFTGNKVTAVKDAYAGLGGSVAPKLDPK
ncbi:MAG: hypothetical protein U0Q16_07355 [Bryobacteraceae bacterium]